jgi:ribulose 1,5-bisphosphate synthetase/thiazole synthase
MARTALIRILQRTYQVARLAARQQVSIANAANAKSPVLIVGAGIAGLTAAYYLVKAGVSVRIIEVSKRTGVAAAREIVKELTRR